MSRLIYSAVFTVLSPLFVLRLLWRSVKEPSYRFQWRQRFALGLPARTRPGEGLIWIHAVSLGELLAVAPLIERLLSEHPQKALLVTNTTPTGAAQTRALFGDRLEFTYCNGLREGTAKYIFADGSIEVFSSFLYSPLVYLFL